MEESWKVVYLQVAPSEVADIVRSCLPPGFELRVLKEGTKAEILEAVRDVDFILVATTPLTADIVRAAKRLKHVQHQGVGYDNVDVAALHRAGVTLGLTPEGTTVGVAEHTILLILALYKKLCIANRRVRAGEWPQFDMRPTSYELRGKTLGLIGFGRIGRAVAKRAKAFEAKIIYYDVIRVPAEVEREMEVEYAPLPDLLTRSDIISLHVPLSDATRGMIGAQEIALMKSSAILINTARGALVDEEALINALREERIAGAGLDVLVHEPPLPDNPLLRMDNVILTPHIAAGTRDALFTKMKAAFANMVRVTKGEQPLHLV